MNVTVVVPIGKLLPASVVITGLGSTRSVAFAPFRNAAIVEVDAGTSSKPTVATTVTSAGGVTTGGVVSCTTTAVVALPVLL